MSSPAKPSHVEGPVDALARLDWMWRKAINTDFAEWVVSLLFMIFLFIAMQSVIVATDRAIHYPVFTDVLGRTVKDIVNGKIPVAAIASHARVIPAMCGALAMSLLFGVLTGRVKFLKCLLLYMFVYLWCTPNTATQIWFGDLFQDNYSGKVFAISFAAYFTTWKMIHNMAFGVTTPTWRYKMPRWERFRRYIYPKIRSAIPTAIEVCVTICWLIVILNERNLDPTTNKGLGVMFWQHNAAKDVTGMFEDITMLALMRQIWVWLTKQTFFVIERKWLLISH